MATQPVGGAQSAHNSSDSVNGRNQTIPAVPAVNGGGFQDHNRKGSMTVGPAGANYNGNAVGGPQNKSGIQFGNIVPGGGSPAMGNTSLPHQGNANLGVNQLNPSQRSASPHAPSPIPQPIEPSGGRPPSNFGSQNGMVFGENDSSVRNLMSHCTGILIRSRTSPVPFPTSNSVPLTIVEAPHTPCRAMLVATRTSPLVPTPAASIALLVEAEAVATTVVINNRCPIRRTTPIVASPTVVACHTPAIPTVAAHKFPAMLAHPASVLATLR